MKKPRKSKLARKQRKHNKLVNDYSSLLLIFQCTMIFLPCFHFCSTNFNYEKYDKCLSI